MAIKRQSADYREREVQAKAVKRQCADVREREAQARAAKCQYADVRGKVRLWLPSASLWTTGRELRLRLLNVSVLIQGERTSGYG